MTDLPTTGLPEAEGGGGKVDFSEVRGLLDRAQAALSDPRLSDEWKHEIQLAVDSLSATLTSAVESIGVGGGDSGGVPAVVSHGFQTEVSEAMQPGVEVFGRQFSEVWNLRKDGWGINQTCQSISDYGQFIRESPLRNALVCVHSGTLVSEISELCQVLGEKHITFEFDENGQHFVAHVGTEDNAQRLSIALVTEFSSGDKRRYGLYTALYEAHSDYQTVQKMVPSFQQGQYCVLSQELSRLPVEQNRFIYGDAETYFPAYDPNFQEKMALFAPVSLDLIFRLIRERAEEENESM